MPDVAGRYDTGLKPLRIESGRLILPAEVAARIENFESTPEGTLISVRGPAPFVPDYGQGYPGAYGNMHGIYHCRLGPVGSREVLLIASGSTIWNFNGWQAGGINTFERLIGAAGSGAVVTADIPDNTGPQYPCQFESTGTGIVIVPQGGRAHFYDGVTVLPLGYDHAPGAPSGWGPHSSGTDEDGSALGFASVNDRGYSNGLIGARRLVNHADFGFRRLGTAVSSIDGTGESGVLEGRYEAAVQWVDYFGNLSPLGPRSGAIHIARQYDSVNIVAESAFLVDAFWRGVDNGPDGTIGKVFCRTRDLLHAGTAALFEVPGNIGVGGVSAYATLPDNVTEEFPDNVPDGWLVNTPPDVLPVPMFKLCRVAFGRLWIANTRDDPGILIPSMPGRWGTFLRGSEMFPDPTGGGVTGLWTTSRGMVVCTISSTYVVAPSDDGKFFTTSTLNPFVGCAAPSSFANMPDGSCIWLGTDGFYRFDGQSLGRISDDILTLIQRINPGRIMQATAAYDWRSGEYRCWVPIDGQRENTLCLCWDGQGWRRRTGEQLRDVCVTKDEWRYMIGVGRVRDSGGTTRDGVWVLDRQTRAFTPAARTFRIETSWIEGFRSRQHKSGRQVFALLRETSTSTCDVAVYRDWRMGSQPADPTIGRTKTCDLDPPDDTPPVWGTTLFGTTTAPSEYVKRRPYWAKEPVYVPDCEVYKLVLTSTARMEFYGLQVTEAQHGNVGRVTES